MYQSAAVTREWKYSSNCLSTVFSGGFCVRAGVLLHPSTPVFGFVPPVWHDATKIVTVNNIILLCRWKRLRIRNLLPLQLYGKYVFTQRIINIWNSLPVHVVNSSSVNSFKNNLDRFWSNQEMYYNFRCDITGTGNRSLSQNWLVILLKYVIKRWTIYRGFKACIFNTDTIRYDIEMRDEIWKLRKLMGKPNRNGQPIEDHKGFGAFHPQFFRRRRGLEPPLTVSVPFSPFLFMLYIVIIILCLQCISVSLCIE